MLNMTSEFNGKSKAYLAKQKHVSWEIYLEEKTCTMIGHQLLKIYFPEQRDPNTVLRESNSICRSCSTVIIPKTVA